MIITRSEFFKRVLPSTGYFCLVGLMHDKSEAAIQELYPIKEAIDGDLDARILELQNAYREVYYCCATLKTIKGRRTAKNSDGYKCFRADIDCGPAKDYGSHKRGLEGLQKFLDATGLPAPMIVNSGGGWHIYWTLDKVIDYNTWKPLADALKAATETLGFRCDPSVTAEGARILRIPGTLHQKDRENPKTVEVISLAEPMTVEEFTAAVRPYMADAPIEGMELFAGVSGLEDPLMKKLVSSSEKLFSKVLSLSLKPLEVVETTEILMESGDIKLEKNKLVRSAGCAQIAYIYRDQSEIHRDLWRAGLSIARNCSDWEEAIHIISRDDEDRYSVEGTIATAEDTVDKPQLCKTFQSLNPSLCLTCPKKGKINTPITLGLTIMQATPLDNLQEDVWHQGLAEHRSIEIPTIYPRPWFRPKTGGVAFMGPLNDSDDTDEDSAQIIYSNDIWVQKRLNDPTFGAVVQIARILPKDGLAEFTMPLAAIQKKDKCADYLGANHVAIAPGKMAALQRYLIDWVKYLEDQGRFSEARDQFGWHENNTRFLIGGREITTDGTIEYSPPCTTTEEIAPLYTAKGDLAVWRSVIDHYDTPGNEARAFTLMISFGSPIYTFFNVNSMLVHLTNSESGVGKTTVQYAVNSVWGEPKKTMLTEHDTPLSRQQRAGVMKNIIICVDELTNIDGEEASNFAFNFSEDRARHRMQSQVNAERRNNVTWCIPCISSGNNSMKDTFKAYRSSPQGELRRLIELEILKDNSLTKAQSDHMFNHLLRDNYGQAGEELMKYVVPNLADVIAEGLEEQRRFDAEASFGSQDRNYSALCASAITMGRIAKRLGLHNIDMDRVRAWAVKNIGNLAAEVTVSGAVDAEAALGHFLNEHNRNILVINDIEAPEGLPMTAFREPYGELVVRYEPKARRVYIARHKLQSWCSAQRIPFAPMWEKLQKQNSVLPDERMCLSRGTSTPGTPVWVVVLDADKIGWHIDTAPAVD